MKSQPIENPLPPPWHHLSIEEVAEKFGTDLTNGLSSSSVIGLRSRYGFNQRTAQKDKPLCLKFLLQFDRPLIYLLLLAGSIEQILGDFLNAAAILGVAVTIAAIGLLQEFIPEGMLAALASTIEREALVWRDGRKIRLYANELVPGDLTILTSGNTVAADLRLVRASNLQIDESVLTGESIAVSKNVEVLEAETPIARRDNMAYAGSFVTFGWGIGIVVATGKDTAIGKKPEFREQKTQNNSFFQHKVNQFSISWLFFSLFLATFTFEISLAQKSFADSVETAIALIVSAIPEGLSAAIALIYGIGVFRSVRNRTIVRQLPALETLGKATVLCLDRTGVITEDRMTVKEIYAGGRHYFVTGSGYNPKGAILFQSMPVNFSQHLALTECLIAGLFCNDTHLEFKEDKWTPIGDPTEAALIIAANKAGLSLSEEQLLMGGEDDSCPLFLSLPKLDAIPFDPQLQYMATLHQTADRKIIYVKGSVESILQRCQKMLGDRGQWLALVPEYIEERVESMATKGLKVMAFAYKNLPNNQNKIEPGSIERDLIFLGLQGINSSLCLGTISAVNACQEAGIELKMITGDSLTTAIAVARQIGLRKHPYDRQIPAFTGEQLARMDRDRSIRAVSEGVVFARVAPEQKLRLVEALQDRGEIVAITGSKVQDAPALKQANIGIALKNSTEAAKEAADLISLDDRLTSIGTSIGESRSFYQNLVKIICFILPLNAGELITIEIATLLGRELPILPLSILWLNLLSCLSVTVLLSLEPRSPLLMKRSLQPIPKSFFPSKRIERILAVGIWNWIVLLVMFEWARQTSWGNIELARTMGIQSLVTSNIIYLLSLSQLFPGAISKEYKTKEKLWIVGSNLAVIAFILFVQFLFTNLSLANDIFQTTPLTFELWSLSLLFALPTIGIAIFANRLDPLQ